jgi:hypothetical protein
MFTMRYEEHPVFIAPDDHDAMIWRYVDFAKLVSLLDTSSLWFARSDTLGDEFEGSYSRRNLEMRPTTYKDIPAESLALFSAHTEAMRRHTYLNCWNLAEYKSAALWRLYVPPLGGVAIRSSFRRLTECFQPSDGDDVPGLANTAFVGRVRYSDYERDRLPEGNVLWPFVHKRRSFEFENEVRACIQPLPMVDDPTAEGGRQIDTTLASPLGKPVGVDLTTLIDAIFQPSAYRNLTRCVCER